MPIDLIQAFSAGSARLVAYASRQSLLPWRRVVVETGLSPEAVEHELQSILDEERMGDGWRFGRADGRFRLVRHVMRRGRRQALVVVSGEVKRSGGGGTRVAMTVRCPVSAMLFFAYFTGSAIVGGLTAAISAAARGSLSSLLVCLLFACVMPILAWALVARQLVPEVRAAEDVLRRALPPAAPTMGPFR